MMVSDILNLKESLIVMAGPCSVESESQVLETARALKRLGVNVLRGGAFKPRTYPESFQGLGEDGLKILAMAREETGMSIVTEAMDLESLRLVEKYADIIQIGSRNSQNFPLLKAAGKTMKPVLLKRGFGNTIDELIGSSRYISMSGNNNIMLVERGIRTFENSTRFTLDVSAVPVLHEKVNYPVIIDPSHPAGNSRYVEPLALAGIAAGADGIIVEVHPDPSRALSDAAQQLNLDQFSRLYSKIKEISRVMNKNVI
ncbi:3-deoxy-7-phosphoheptulonate synthase [Picrophilus oshimae]|uniref:3-deoxy-D-arabinoheptulosonate-7-phosphate synthase n=1 Tax=Picrophilus torridus (strain ATCC 700027 / DSM 9790 / JCM 10055 / NBRC 100828 / KAW 2/3) TaxID=1122961 RepID=A0A8G2FWI8_PICTO|nr:3-deoxy-7-phosphoheptulonate synthase [Picrophilus oshimae]SMD30761.1 3-deoxy-D-arabinoheptulosonate-7-phosphate synthase [Picrophilus oshimae DSM 9789]